MAASSGCEEESTNDVSFRIIPNPAWRMELLKPIHTNYCRHLLFKASPVDFQEYDMSKMTFLHFALTTLDILQSIETLTQKENEDIVEFIYAHQLLNPPDAAGFLGSTTLQLKEQKNSFPIQWYTSHVTMTYAALVSLLTLRNNLGQLDRYKILQGVAYLQNKDGSFRAGPSCSESDMRFVYSAVCVCYILNDFSLIDVPKLLTYIRNSLTYEGAFGSGSCGTEGHAAYTFCATASLVLLDKLNQALKPEEINQIRRWCLYRQIGGFTGRANKLEDTCYSYWVGATLSMLGSTDLSDCKENIEYLLHNQNPIIGGVGKTDNEYPDPLHTFMGIAGLSLAHYENLDRVYPALTMTENAFVHLQNVQKSW